MPLRHDFRRGAALMLAATALFTGMSALVKAVGERIPFTEIMFFRSVLAMPVVLLLAMRRGGTTLRTQRLPQHALRACTGTLAMGCSFWSLTVLPISEQTALTFTTPIFVALLAVPFLGERLGPWRIAGVALGFGGILAIALGKGAFGGAMSSLVMAGMAAATLHGVFSACTTLLVRSLSATESSATIVLWQSILMTLLSGLTLPFVWVTPGAGELWLLVLVGLVGGVAQVLLTEAWASAQVSSLGPFSYTGVIWAALIGWLVFAEPQRWTTLAGAGLIVLAGLAILRGEMGKGRA
jgi:drug/metabolite transporter (DMT)-like permease